MKKRYPTYEIIKDIGSGLNYKRKDKDEWFKKIQKERKYRRKIDFLKYLNIIQYKYIL
jgi:predicted site-specific integrase-resolvase